MKDRKFGFDELVSIMDRLRSPEGCPWDKEQTKESLKTYLVEEVYEILEAIDGGDPSALKEELGDLFFHILFLSRISAEGREFDIRDVIDAISKKMIRRHPHVFGDKRVFSSGEVERNWSDLKEREKDRKSLLEGVPRYLPALLRAYRITERASRMGFDWQRVADVFRKLDEEVRELDQSLTEGHAEKIEDEMLVISREYLLNGKYVLVQKGKKNYFLLIFN